jgi:protein O-GlcNAc transferase
MNRTVLDKLVRERLRVGYVSSNFGNHPVSHLMQNVFAMHNRSAIEVFCYALSTADGSGWRKNIEGGCEHFIQVDAKLSGAAPIKPL